MALNQNADQTKSDQHTLTTEREELMIPFTNDGLPTCRKAHFLKPLLNPTDKSLPKPPSFTQSLNPKLITTLTKNVNFKGRPKPQRSWKRWVDDMQQSHGELWRKVGIFDAIRGSTYKIKRDNELVVGLAEKWCPKSNTFVFSWGECGITLEDVMVLGGFSVLGVSVLTPDHSREFGDIEKKLVNACSEIKKINASVVVTHYGWMDYFKGSGVEIEHVAFLVLWLCRYVFFTSPFIGVSSKVFILAINLAKGIRIALAPAVLSSIYRELCLLKEKIVVFTTEGVHDGSELILWAQFQLVQVWVWERFPTLSPKPNCLVLGEPRLARWHNVRRLNVSLKQGVDMESAADLFLWRPYGLSLKNWEFPKFYSDCGVVVVINSEVDEQILSFARCLRTCELVGVDCVEQYLPHRVSMQFGFDQDIPPFVPRLNADFELAWSSYTKPLDGFRIYLPPRLLEGDVTVLYSNWRKPELGLCDNEALIVYARQRRSSRKLKKLSQILQGGKEVIGGEAPAQSLRPCSEAIGLDSGSGVKVIVSVKAPSCEGMVSEDPVSVIYPLIGLDDTQRCQRRTPVEVEKDKEVSGSNMITGGGSEHMEATYSENESSTAFNKAQSVKESLSGIETEKLCSVLADDEHTKHLEDADLKKASNSLVHVEEGNCILSPIETLNQLDYGISRLQKVLCLYKAAMFGK